MEASPRSGTNRMSTSRFLPSALSRLALLSMLPPGAWTPSVGSQQTRRRKPAAKAAPEDEDKPEKPVRKGKNAEQPKPSDDDDVPQDEKPKRKAKPAKEKSEDNDEPA